MPPVDTVFEAELARRGIAFKRLSLREYEIDARGLLLSVSIENLNREYMRDGDEQAVRRFVDAIEKGPSIPPWEQARPLLFWSAEPAAMADDSELVAIRVSPKVAKVLVLTDAEESGFTYVSRRMLDDWAVSAAAVREVADANQSGLLKNVRAAVEEWSGTKVGMVPIGSALKASVIFSPTFKQFVADALGWPVLVVIPCRDFILMISEKDQQLLGRMGGVVQREFRQSGYPIATEVLRVSDEGIKGIGAFPE